MSAFHLLAADRAIPLCDDSSWQMEEHTVGQNTISIPCRMGFALFPRPLNPCDILHCETKPHCYELSLSQDEVCLAAFKKHLSTHLVPGETVELWSVWASSEIDRTSPPHFNGRLSDFDMDTLAQFLADGERCLKITI